MKGQDKVFSYRKIPGTQYLIIVILPFNALAIFSIASTFNRLMGRSVLLIKTEKEYGVYDVL